VLIENYDLDVAAPLAIIYLGYLKVMHKLVMTSMSYEERDNSSLLRRSIFESHSL
jgi:hypothetical protein